MPTQNRVLADFIVQVQNSRDAASLIQYLRINNNNTPMISSGWAMNKEFIENNAPKFEQWLERVAETNPAKAIELVSNLSDYVLPKLARTEIVGDEEQPLSIDLTKIDDKTLAKLDKAFNEGKGKS